MEANEHLLKQRVQRNILIGSAVILIAKFFAYYITNSVGILTDAMESIVNVAAGAISLFCLYIAAIPKDNSHPFGHGKIELISASVEGILIIIAGGLIVYEGVKRLISPDEIQKLDLGMAIIVISGLANYLMGWYSVRIGNKHRSMALIADGKHLQSDAYSTVGLLLGLALLYFTGWKWVDSTIAILFGFIIAITGISILRKTTDNLLDAADMDLLKDLADTLNQQKSADWIDIHNVKILKYGSSIHMNCDLTLPKFYTIEQGHHIGANLQQSLVEKYAGSIVLTIHLDPCNIFEHSKCHKCQCAACPYREEAFTQAEVITVQSFVNNETEFC